MTTLTLKNISFFFFCFVFFFSEKYATHSSSKPQESSFNFESRFKHGPYRQLVLIHDGVLFTFEQSGNTEVDWTGGAFGSVQIKKLPSFIVKNFFFLFLGSLTLVQYWSKPCQFVGSPPCVTFI